MDVILLIIGIVYGVCRIVIKLVQQCTYFLFSVNLLLVGVNYGQRTINKRQNTNYSFLPVTSLVRSVAYGESKVSCIRRKRGQKVVHKLFNVKYLPLLILRIRWFK